MMPAANAVSGTIGADGAVIQSVNPLDVAQEGASEGRKPLTAADGAERRFEIVAAPLTLDEAPPGGERRADRPVGVLHHFRPDFADQRLIAPAAQVSRD